MSRIIAKTYKKKDKKLIEDFRILSFQEGNDSLAYDKYDPDNIDGETFMVFVDDVLAAVSVVESSHYTGDPEYAARVCRLHIAKQFRPSWLGMFVGKAQIEWAKVNGYKVLYFTHDINNRAINAMYQHRKFGAAHTELQKDMQHLWHEDWYKDLKTDTRLLFQVDPSSTMLQYVYYWTLEEGFKWYPLKNVVWTKHDGRIKGSKNVKERKT